MGRRKLNKTPREIERQKKKWFGEERNAKRREKYRKDREYRRKVAMKNRINYQVANGVLDSSDLPSFSALSSIGEVRSFDKGSYTVSELCFTTEELAEALGGYTKHSLYGWQREEQLPRPIYHCHDLTRQKVYTLPEASAMVEIFREHRKVKKYYSKRDIRTTTQLFEVIELIRSKVE